MFMSQNGISQTQNPSFLRSPSFFQLVHQTAFIAKVPFVLQSCLHYSVSIHLEDVDPFDGISHVAQSNRSDGSQPLMLLMFVGKKKITTHQIRSKFIA